MHRSPGIYLTAIYLTAEENVLYCYITKLMELTAGSNPAEVDGLFQDVKILSTIPPGATLSWRPLKNLKAEK